MGLEKVIRADQTLHAVGKLAREQARLPVAPLTAASAAALEERILASLHELEVVELQKRSKLARRRAWLACGSGAAAVMAAASALLILWPAPSAPSPLPDYKASFQGGQRQQRSEARSSPERPGSLGYEDEVAWLAPGGRVTFTLRPAVPVGGSVDARILAVRAREVRPLEPRPRVSRDGAARFVAPSDELLRALSPGGWELVLIVGRPDDLGLDPAGLLACSALPDSRLRVGRQRVWLSSGRP